MPERTWVDTGHQERIDSPTDIDRIPPFDPRSGDHLWIVVTSYRVNPAQFTSPDPGVTPLLDHESLLAVAGPACYYCEQAYTSSLARRRCRGDR